MMKCGRNIFKNIICRPARTQLYCVPVFAGGRGEEGEAGSRERKSEVGAQGSGGVNFGRLALAGRGFFDIGVEGNAEKLKL